MRAGALKRPGLVIGAVRGRLFDRADHSANSSASPIRSSAFSGAGLTMGMLLSVPLMLTGVAFIAAALKRPPLRA